MYNKASGANPNLKRPNHQTYIRSKEKEIYHSDYQAGNSVKEGDVVGFVTDEFGELLAEYKATSSGVILYKIATPPINIGDTVMCISSNL